MNIHFVPFHLPKAGNTQLEYEDAYYLFPNDSKHNRFCCAIADGASEGMLNGKWARILCREYCRSSKRNRDVRKLIAHAQRRWDIYMTHYKAEREARKQPFQWYEEISMQRGAFSTLLGLTISWNEAKQRGKWQALGVGDSCLFQARNERLLESFPVDNSSAFGVRPILISSNSFQNNPVFSAAKFAFGRWQIGDTFYLLTDALAFWFLREIETGQMPMEVLGNFERGKPRSFKKWVNHLRENRFIRNDDVTLLIIKIFPPADNPQK